MSSTSSGDDNSECETCYCELGKNPVACSNGCKICSGCIKAYITSNFHILEDFDKIECSMKCGGMISEKDAKTNMTEIQKEII